jgi:hypothetical protein
LDSNGNQAGLWLKGLSSTEMRYPDIFMVKLAILCGCERSVCAAARYFVHRKKNEKNEKSLLTLCQVTPYMPLTNEGGAPLAQISSPL